MLKRCISGGQSGADIAALKTAKEYGIPTGGWMPKGWITLNGPKPEYAELYGIEEHASFGYKPRTWSNIKDSSGTIRLAFNFFSAGEICTLNGIKKYDKPYIDVDLANPIPVQQVIDWINQNNIEILNVAGNSEKSCPGTFSEVCEYLSAVFNLLGFKKEDL
jgi:hypothetical protein